jgi:uncharacterized protein
VSAAAHSGGPLRIGLVSDTHGWLDPRAVAALAREVPLAAIVHAGDIGKPEVLWGLEAIAPVTAVLGNCDRAMPGFDLAGLARITVGGVRILAIHDLGDLGPIPDDVDVVVRGHSHIPSVQWHGKTLVANPGSASQRRSQSQCTVGILEIFESGEAPGVRIVSLDEFGARSR